MRNLIMLFVAVLVFTACTNSADNNTTSPAVVTEPEATDTVVVKDTVNNVDNNTVTPPASNGQF